MIVECNVREGNTQTVIKCITIYTRHNKNKTYKRCFDWIKIYVNVETFLFINNIDFLF